MERIVVGVGDTTGQRAAEWAGWRARRRSARIELVRAFDMLESDPLDNQARLDDLRRHLLSELSHTEVTTTLQMKTVPDALTDAARHADLVVLGAHRDRPIRSTLRGSLPLRVASRSRAVTVIVPTDWQPTVAASVVVGLDEGDTSDSALEWGAREASALHGMLTVIHTWAVPPTSMADVPLLAEDAEVRESHRRELADAVERVRDAHPHLRVQAFLEERPTAPALADHARDAALLVLGSHRRGPLTGLVMGSTARAVLARSSTPLCIVPPMPSGEAARYGADALVAGA